jgi:hypothetical protein
MTQSATPPSTGIQAAPRPAPADATPPAKAAGLSFGWRVALTLWVAAFLGLLAYELLSTLVRSIGRMF